MFFRMLSRASFQIRRAASSEFTLEKLTGADAGIAIMSINRPKAMNSFSRSMVNATKEAIMECKVNVID
jgi:enoyl-CoA hydratase/carnithine racemase